MPGAVNPNESVRPPLRRIQGRAHLHSDRVHPIRRDGVLNSPWQKSSRHSTVPASRRTALRLGHILSVCSLIAPCPAGAGTVSVLARLSPRTVKIVYQCIGSPAGRFIDHFLPVAGNEEPGPCQHHRRIDLLGFRKRVWRGRHLLEDHATVQKADDDFVTLTDPAATVRILAGSDDNILRLTSFLVMERISRRTESNLTSHGPASGLI